MSPIQKISQDQFLGLDFSYSKMTLVQARQGKAEAYRINHPEGLWGRDRGDALAVSGGDNFKPGAGGARGDGEDLEGEERKEYLASQRLNI